MTGTTTGNKTYTVTLSSTEADADPTDNSVDGSVRVRDTDDEDDGGGSIGWLFLALLAGVSWHRRASESRRTS